MIIIADQNIPQVADAFADLGEVRLLPGRDIRNQHLKECDCLIIRTVTRVDAELIANTPVKFIGSATIGTDHVDLDLLKTCGITFTNAAGCNAEAASEYVISGIFALAKQKGIDPFKRKAGIIGFGNVGSRLFDKLDTLGIECLVNDPPLQLSGKSKQRFVDLNTIINECDLISLHTPLTRTGTHPSFHLFGYERLGRLRENCLLVNAARGEVIDNPALIKVLDERKDLTVFLDTWENEPTVSRELLARVDLATPHIAGYSVEGRLRGTQMVLDAACRFFNQSSSWQMTSLLPEPITLELPSTHSDLDFWQNLFIRHFDISRDDKAFKAGMGLNDADFGQLFESLRRVYPDRLEYDRFKLSGIKKTAAASVQRLRFGVD
ncbi:MAG: erythronate-4-phosphate dehydrogenase [Planctomycetota bacterium]|jgi:erythronate-4-phosphate dehydrogenase